MNLPHNHTHESGLPNPGRISFLVWLRVLRKVYLTRSRRTYYSQYGEDIVYDRVLNLRAPGFYVDVGCFHPTKYNNTYKLYRHGWRGINIDLDEMKIRAFDLRRPQDVNLLAAVSDESREVTLFSFGFYSLVQTLDPSSATKVMGRQPHCVESKVSTTQLTQLIDQTRFRNRKIDVLSVDVEGLELEVLRSLAFDRYQPKLIVVESHERVLEAVMSSPLYEFLVAHGYQLFNWTGPSLLFLHPRERDCSPLP